MGCGAGMIRTGSGALGMAYVAAGRIDGYLENHINAWDVLAGLVLVQEAGGYVSDFLAGEGLEKGNPVLACTPKLRRALVKASGIGEVERLLVPRWVSLSGSPNLGGGGGQGSLEQCGKV